MVDLVRGVVSDMKNILCFGDSNTHGRIPGVVGPGRYPREKRWPGVLEGILGADFHVIEEGLGSRTAVMEDFIEGRMSGLDYLVPCLTTHAPLDLVILQLGTNDMKARYNLSPVDVTLSIERLVKIILSSAAGPDGFSNPKILVLVPLHVDDVGHFKFHEMFAGAPEKSRRLAPYFFDMEKRYQGVFVLDVGEWVLPSLLDGIHMDDDGHRLLATLVANKVREILV